MYHIYLQCEMRLCVWVSTKECRNIVSTTAAGVWTYRPIKFSMLININLLIYPINCAGLTYNNIFWVFEMPTCYIQQVWHAVVPPPIGCLGWTYPSHMTTPEVAALGRGKRVCTCQSKTDKSYQTASKQHFKTVLMPILVIKTFSSLFKDRVCYLTSSQ